MSAETVCFTQLQSGALPTELSEAQPSVRQAIFNPHQWKRCNLV